MMMLRRHLRNAGIAWAATMIILALWVPRASAQATEGPWGSEDPNEWCLEHGDYSDPNAPKFPTECSAYWHPVASPEPTTEVQGHEPQVRPTKITTRQYHREPLADTGLAVDQVAGLTLIGLGLIGVGLSARRYGRRL